MAWLESSPVAPLTRCITAAPASPAVHGGPVAPTSFVPSGHADRAVAIIGRGLCNTPGIAPARLGTVGAP